MSDKQEIERLNAEVKRLTGLIEDRFYRASCGAFRFEDGGKLDGCDHDKKCAGCGSEMCHHWKRCPRCDRRKADLLEKGLAALINRGVNPPIACGHNPDVIDLNNEIISLKSRIAEIVERRDRYEKALEQIAERGDFPVTASSIIARDALHEC